MISFPLNFDQLWSGEPWYHKYTANTIWSKLYAYITVRFIYICYIYIFVIYISNKEKEGVNLRESRRVHGRGVGGRTERGDMK